MPYKSRYSEQLLKGRVSNGGAIYFLTWCTANRVPLLALESNREVAHHSLLALEADGDGTVFAATIMPDHIHLLVELGSRLTVSQLVAKTKAGITRTGSAVKWQLNFFEHRLRAHESAEDYAFYIFMNPYCADLCSLEQAWWGWIVSRQVRWQFEEKLRAGGLPEPEWLGQAGNFAATLPAGAD